MIPLTVPWHGFWGCPMTSMCAVVGHIESYSTQPYAFDAFHRFVLALPHRVIRPRIPGTSNGADVSHWETNAVTLICLVVSSIVAMAVRCCRSSEVTRGRCSNI